MPHAFSAIVDGVGLHIRIAPNFFTRHNLTDERPHKHFFIEFHYVYEGEETLFFPTKEKRIPLKAGDLAMIPRQVYHCAETQNEKTVVRLCFDFNIEPEENSEHAIYQIFQNAHETHIFSAPFITQAMDRFRTASQNEKDPIRETRLGTILLDVILELFSQIGTDQTRVARKSQTKLRQKWLIEEHIGTRYHSPDGLDGLAKKLFLTPRQTRKLVKRFCGEDYKTLIVRQRMEMARLYLKSDKLSLEEIAEKCGYRSYSGFHLAFVRSFGMAPGEYRKKQRE